MPTPPPLRNDEYAQPLGTKHSLMRDDSGPERASPPLAGSLDFPPVTLPTRTEAPAMRESPPKRRLPLPVCAFIGVYALAWLVLNTLNVFMTPDLPLQVAIPGAAAAIGAGLVLLATAAIGSRPRPKSTPAPARVATATWPAWIPVAASLIQVFTADSYQIPTSARFDVIVNALIAAGFTLVYIRPSLRRLRRR